MTLSVYADSVEWRSSDGTRRIHAQRVLAESVGAEARDIVRTGLGDVLAWLDDCAADYTGRHRALA